MQVIPVRLPVLLLLMVQAFAVSVSISPGYVRMPVGSNQSFEIQMVGDGKLYELSVYGSYLSWQKQKIWVGPTGKSVQVVFSPLQQGEYTISAEMGDAHGEAVAHVYAPSASSVMEEIKRLRSQFSDPEALKILDEAERLYNESRFGLAEMKLRELEGYSPPETRLPEAPKFFLVALLAVAAVVAAKLLLG